MKAGKRAKMKFGHIQHNSRIIIDVHKWNFIKIIKSDYTYFRGERLFNPISLFLLFTQQDYIRRRPQ